MIQKSQIQLYFETLFTPAGGEPFQGYPTATYENLALTNDMVANMSVLLADEILAYYYKAVLSYAESIPSICEKHYSWATVKLYYSTFYALRAFLLCKEYVFLRAGVKRNHLFYVLLKNGEKLKKADSSDHKSTIELQKTKFPTEWLMSQPITDGVETLSSYDWLIKRREDVNYKDILFRDPIPSDFWVNLSADIDRLGISDIVDQLVNDPGILCFQPEYAVLGIPTKRLLFTSMEIHNRGIYFNEVEKLDFLDNTTSCLDSHVWKEALDL